MSKDKRESPFKTLEAQVEKNDKAPPYVYETHVLRAVKVAGAIGRVLLVRGDPGTGKSTLARNVANALGWDYFESVITSRSQARDLLWTFDQVERLNDAYSVDRSNDVREKKRYVEPGALWWAFDPALAHEVRPRATLSAAPRPGAVVLIDEIDKADPDLPNDLLVPLEAKRFWADPLERCVTATRPVFVVVSTNEERDLPQAFLRRAIVVKLERPVERARLLEIAGKHFEQLPGDIFDATLSAYLASGERATSQDLRAPGTAEMLDALRACEELQIERSDHPEFKLVVEAALWKHGAPKT